MRARSSSSGHDGAIIVLFVSGIACGISTSPPSRSYRNTSRPSSTPSPRSSIVVWIVHLYAAIWVKGTVRAMTHGTVTGGWAWKHHRKWLREEVSKPAP